MYSIGNQLNVLPQKPGRSSFVLLWFRQQITKIIFLRKSSMKELKKTPKNMTQRQTIEYWSLKIKDIQEQFKAHDQLLLVEKKVLLFQYADYFKMGVFFTFSGFFFLAWCGNTRAFTITEKSCL